MSYVDSASDWYSASVPATIYWIFLSVYLDFHADWEVNLDATADKPYVAVTKSPFVTLSVSKIFDLRKVPTRLFQSHLYFTGSTATDLRRPVKYESDNLESLVNPTPELAVHPSQGATISYVVPITKQSLKRMCQNNKILHFAQTRRTSFLIYHEINI